MEDLSVTMVRGHMEDIPEIPSPEGFGIRNHRHGEGHIWTRIEQAAEPFVGIDLITGEGEEVGTITAWWNAD